jgi:hypothetical protein
MVDDEGDEIWHAVRVTLHRSFMAEVGSATCAPGWRPRSSATSAWRSNSYRRAPRRIALRSGISGAGKRSAPTTPRGSKRATPTSRSSFARLRLGAAPHPRAVHGVHRAAPSRGCPGKPPDRRCRDRCQRTPSSFPSIYADGAHPLSNPRFHREGKNTLAKLGHPRVLDRDGEISRDRPVFFAPEPDLEVTSAAPISSAASGTSLPAIDVITRCGRHHVIS